MFMHVESHFQELTLRAVYSTLYKSFAKKNDHHTTIVLHKCGSLYSETFPIHMEYVLDCFEFHKYFDDDGGKGALFMKQTSDTNCPYYSTKLSPCQYFSKFF